ncbi:hypothetical protein CORC01_06475 [Colletotrichum orchidophilum]|uniref:Uncharacterized protein n=1 Tax=Colletotrichum orchidophilum TaxID=1209926 RepID=A0A1G4BA63_9PEZI|nr:uncharacterized protein CORC01_06475 [Colletotrichum orchidophilum]OHE98278.1 hypothetical protein CORC01_06475 [Colletotrichum orchidophilum]
MKFQHLLVFAAGVIAAPAPEEVAKPVPVDIGATVPSHLLICAGAFIEVSEIDWAMRNRRDELQLNAGWWDEVPVACQPINGTHTAQPVFGIRFMYNHTRDEKVKTEVEAVFVQCKPPNHWNLTCDDV